MSLDFTAVTGAIDTTTIVVAITAVAAIKILPGVARWGFDKVIDWFGLGYGIGVNDYDPNEGLIEDDPEYLEYLKKLK